MAKRRKRPGAGARGARQLTLSVEAVSGTINYFFAFVDHERVINDDGTRKRSWTGEVAAAQVPVKVRVTGIGSAQYKLGIDLPGTVDDQSLTFKLQGGYHEAEITI